MEYRSTSYESSHREARERWGAKQRRRENMADTALVIATCIGLAGIFMGVCALFIL